MRHPVRDVVVVVPGILGSRLERAGRPIWGDAGVAAALLGPEHALGLQGDGFAPEPDVVATGLIGRLAQFPGLSKIDAYDRLTEGCQHGSSWTRPTSWCSPTTGGCHAGPTRLC